MRDAADGQPPGDVERTCGSCDDLRAGEDDLRIAGGVKEIGRSEMRVALLVARVRARGLDAELD
jgi:hypothetical protein